MNWWLGLIGPGGMALVMGVVIGWDRWREPRRDPRRVMAVVDRRTLRDALRRADRLDLTDDAERRAIIGHLTAARMWLIGEIRVGPRRRRLWCAVQLRVVEMMLVAARAPAGLYS